MNQAILDDPLLSLDERLGRVSWPSMREIEVPSIGTRDCLLMCAGFEDRAIEPLRRVCERQRAGFSLGLISYLPKQTENSSEEMRSIAQKAGFNVTEFVYDREKPSGMGEELWNFSRVFDRVFVDISGMSRLLIVQILVALIVEQNLPISIIYGEAEEYSPSEEKFERDNKSDDRQSALSYLSSGIFEIAATPELSSVSMLGEALRLVAFPSFDPAQLTNLIQELQPTYTEFIHGTPPAQSNKWRTQAIRRLNKRVLDELQDTKSHEASTLDYTDTLEILLSIYARRSMFDRLVVSPTGSKMQAVAVGLFRSVLHDIQIVYPTPQIFDKPAEYTLGLRQLYQLDLPTGAISDVIKSVEADEDDSHQPPH